MNEAGEIFQLLPGILPLPAGEGRGEGERHHKPKHSATNLPSKLLGRLSLTLNPSPAGRGRQQRTRLIFRTRILNRHPTEDGEAPESAYWCSFVSIRGSKELASSSRDPLRFQIGPQRLGHRHAAVHSCGGFRSSDMTTVSFKSHARIFRSIPGGSRQERLPRPSPVAVRPILANSPGANACRYSYGTKHRRQQLFLLNRINNS